MDRFALLRPIWVKRCVWIVIIVVVYMLCTHKENTPSATVARFCDAISSGKYNKAFKEFSIDEMYEGAYGRRIAKSIWLSEIDQLNEHLVKGLKFAHISEAPSSSGDALVDYFIPAVMKKVELEVEDANIGYLWRKQIEVVKKGMGRWRVFPDWNWLKEKALTSDSYFKINTPDATARRFGRAIAFSLYKLAADELSSSTKNLYIHKSLSDGRFFQSEVMGGAERDRWVHAEALRLSLKKDGGPVSAFNGVKTVKNVTRSSAMCEMIAEFENDKGKKRFLTLILRKDKNEIWKIDEDALTKCLWNSSNVHVRQDQKVEPKGGESKDGWFDKLESGIKCFAQFLTLIGFVCPCLIALFRKLMRKE